jgi:hypothetical protein
VPRKELTPNAFLYAKCDHRDAAVIQPNYYALFREHLMKSSGTIGCTLSETSTESGYRLSLSYRRTNGRLSFSPKRNWFYFSTYGIVDGPCYSRVHSNPLRAVGTQSNVHGDRPQQDSRWTARQADNSLAIPPSGNRSVDLKPKRSDACSGSPDY